MPKKSSPPYPAIPEPVAGINVNHCKNPNCANFGVPAQIEKWRRRSGTPLENAPGTSYRLSGAGKNRPALKCLLCGEIFSMKSNLAIAEEVHRAIQYLRRSPEPSCPNEDCDNHGVPVSTPHAYSPHGLTRGGTPRWRCKGCGKTFSRGGRATKRQRITHLNKTILLSLTNKMPLRRIMKVTGANAATLYGKIKFLHRQCLAFAASRERALQELPIRRLYLSVDRQDYAINWNRSADRRNIILRGVGSACNDTGYVFGMHLAFDPSLDPAAVEADAEASDDALLPYPHRKYARLWLAADYEESAISAAKERARRTAKAARGVLAGDLHSRIEDAYEAAAEREDTEASDIKDPDQKIADRMGVQVHEEYTLYGHFFFLRGLLQGVDTFRFFLDQDSGMRAACLAAFHPLIKQRRADAFYVRAGKEMTIDRKRAAIARSRAEMRRWQEANPGITPAEVELEMMKAEIARAVEIGKWSDRWCRHPLPNMSEPEKAVCWLTDLGDYDEDHQARLFLKASLRAVDNFFQRVRRSLNPLERPLLTASRSRRTWYGYNPYNPAMAERLLDIYRVMHNFVETGKDGRTPAMRLGLSKVPVPVEDIIYQVY